MPRCRLQCGHQFGTGAATNGVPDQFTSDEFFEFDDRILARISHWIDEHKPIQPGELRRDCPSGHRRRGKPNRPITIQATKHCDGSIRQRGAVPIHRRTVLLPPAHPLEGLPSFLSPACCRHEVSGCTAKRRIQRNCGTRRQDQRNQARLNQTIPCTIVERLSERSL